MPYFVGISVLAYWVFGLNAMLMLWLIMFFAAFSLRVLIVAAMRS